MIRATKGSTRILAFLLGLGLLGGTGCATAAMRGLHAAGGGSGHGKRLPPYSPLVGDAWVAKVGFPLATPFAIADMPLTFACETVYLPFFLCGIIFDEMVREEPRPPAQARAGVALADEVAAVETQN